jgi:hypothetical protein
MWATLRPNYFAAKVTLVVFSPPAVLSFLEFPQADTREPVHPEVLPYLRPAPKLKLVAMT